MGSICDVAEEVIDYLNAHGQKVGLVKVRLYRPWRAEDVYKRQAPTLSSCSPAPWSPPSRLWLTR